MDATERFPLFFAARLLAKFAPPAGPFDPAGAWENSYNIHCLVGNVNVPVGRFTVRRTPAGKGARLEIEHVKLLGTDKAHRIAGKMECAADELATPARWEYAAHVAGPAGELRFTGRPPASPAGDHTCTWALFDAVQRWPRDTAPRRFTLLSPDGTVVGERVLRFRESVTAKLGGGDVALNAIEHTGAGALPWIYYTDARGHLLIAISGLEAYILEARNA